MTFSEEIKNACAEGSVLLKNDGVLPFAAGEKIAVFGRAQIEYYKSGTGSGGSVHVPYTTNLIEGFEKLSKEHKDCPVLNQEVLEAYRKYIKENPFDNGGGAWAAEPWCQKEMPLTEELVEKSAKDSSKAVVVIGRTAGEDQDNAAEKGSYYLTDTEKNNILLLARHYSSIIIVLNVSNIIDLSWTEAPELKDRIKAILYTWQGGIEGGNAAAEVLSGTMYPSGKLTDTIARNIEDYPCSSNFGSQGKNLYEEDIYVGYRYFATFNKDAVLYPFGFGLGYTTFATEIKDYTVDGLKAAIKVNVRNTGSKSGKETVQLYLEAPQGLLGKSRISLVAFKKTPELKAGEECTVELLFDAAKTGASFDDTGATGNPGCLVLEKGEYILHMGTSSVDLAEVKSDRTKNIYIEETFAVEQLTRAMSPEESIKVLTTGGKNADGSYERKYRSINFDNPYLEKRIKENLPKEIKYTGNKGIKFMDVKKNPGLLDDFIGQLNTVELCTLVRGEGMLSRKTVSGIASAFGGLTNELYAYGIPVAGCSDGPSGIRRDTGEQATLIPIGTLLACTWNPEIVFNLYAFVGKEMKDYEIDFLLGPGINIHRSPLNGRNFEYYSEDPYISGVMAVQAVKGLKSQGANATIKHFACNNQEKYRTVTDSIVSERALREIYLKPFEMAVKEGNCISIMTSYNKINGHHSASNYDLLSTILFKEWKFKGFVMTDWWAIMNDCASKENAERKNLAAMVKARNDIYMVVSNDTAGNGGDGDNLMQSLKQNTLTKAELQLCAKDILKVLLECGASDRPLKELDKVNDAGSSLPQAKDGLIAAETEKPFEISGKEICLHIAKDGTYRVCAEIIKEKTEIPSQSTTNILFNGKTCASFTCQTTDGKIIFVSGGLVKLDAGYYVLSADEVKKGVTIKTLAVLNCQKQ